jgi:hypothetical protein
MGVLYIIGTVAGILSVVFTGSILGGPDYLSSIAANENQVIVGALCALIMALALAMVPVMMYPISRKFSESLALGYVVFRGALETVTYILVVTSTLLLVAASRAFLAGAAGGAPASGAPGRALLEAGDWISSITTFVFILGALMFYTVLYRARLVPRWISAWGLIATAPYLAAGFLVLFGLTGHMSTLDTVLRLPLGVQEMVLAVWLIVKGFSPSAIEQEVAPATVSAPA